MAYDVATGAAALKAAGKLAAKGLTKALAKGADEIADVGKGVRNLADDAARAADNAAAAADDAAGAASGSSNAAEAASGTCPINPEGAPSGLCFAAGTVVATPDGLRPIEDIEEGDAVYAWDETTGKVQVAQVAGTISRRTGELLLIRVGAEVLRVTPNHPFWVEEQGWVEARALKSGTLLSSASDGRLQVESIGRVVRAAPVYNIHVAECETYFVSRSFVLVHNNSCAQPGSYTNTHQSGTNYHGKGSQARSQESGRRIANQHNDPHVSTDWTPAQNNREAFKQEHRRLEGDGGAQSPSNYNQINSPGKKYSLEDGG